MKRTLNTVTAFISWALLMTALDQGDYLLSLSMAVTLAVSFMIEAEMI